MGTPGWDVVALGDAATGLVPPPRSFSRDFPHGFPLPPSGTQRPPRRPRRARQAGSTGEFFQQDPAGFQWDPSRIQVGLSLEGWTQGRSFGKGKGKEGGRKEENGKAGESRAAFPWCPHALGSATCPHPCPQGCFVPTIPPKFPFFPFPGPQGGRRCLWRTRSPRPSGKSFIPLFPAAPRIWGWPLCPCPRTSEVTLVTSAPGTEAEPSSHPSQTMDATTSPSGELRGLLAWFQGSFPINPCCPLSPPRSGGN